MKNRTTKMIFLILIPVIVVTIAMQPGTVRVFGGGTSESFCFMQPLQQYGMGWCAPMAVVLNYIIFGMAVLYAVLKKRLFLRAVFGISFVTMFLATLPIIVHTTPKIVLTPFVAILLGLECLSAYLMLKKENQTEENGKRLSRR